MGSSSTKSRTKSSGEIECRYLMLKRTGSQLLNNLVALAGAVALTGALFWATNAQSIASVSPLEKEISGQSKRLSSSNEEERRDALMRLGALHVPEASRASLPGLSDASPMVRAVAANAVLSLPAAESVSALLPLMNDKDEFVRREAAYALGHTKGRSATTVLIEHLQTDREVGVRAAAAVGLGEIADENAVVALSSVLSGSTKKAEKNVFVLRASAVALGNIKSRAGTPALIAALSNAKFPGDVRREAARGLGKIGDPSAVTALQTAASSTDPYLADVAYNALKAIRH
ncbi:MAG: hypothetical protein C5B55_03450 [Blastocatellia bacterium]|nr:MAG: hypothetical protein C5B55_03450 [Blastocatellia bacterium]